jgi:hypothetical protein
MLKEIRKKRVKICVKGWKTGQKSVQRTNNYWHNVGRGKILWGALHVREYRYVIVRCIDTE